MSVSDADENVLCYYSLSDVFQNLVVISDTKSIEFSLFFLVFFQVSSFDFLSCEALAIEILLRDCGPFIHVRSYFINNALRAFSFQLWRQQGK